MSQTDLDRDNPNAAKVLGPAVIRGVLLALVIFALDPGPILAQSPSDTVRVSLPFTRQHSIRSRINGREYQVSVAFPPDYSFRTEDTTRYRILYVLDGNDAFPLAVQAHRLRRIGQLGAAWPDIIIVGIGYAVNRYAETMALRNEDYTPTVAPPQPECFAFGRLPRGGAPAFLRVLREEIIPFIDGRYRTTADRGIMGHSLGGLFAFYALFESPLLFQRYAALSPSLHFDHEIMLRTESKLARERTPLKGKLFMAASDHEIDCLRESTQRMLDSLRVHRHVGLQVESHIFLGESHISVVPGAIGRALQALGYDPPPT
jgi:hypothetical protein